MLLADALDKAARTTVARSTAIIVSSRFSSARKKALMAGLNSVGFSNSDNGLIWNLSAPDCGKCQMRSCYDSGRRQNQCAPRTPTLGSRRVRLL